MITLCEKCNSNEAKYTLEITLMKICKRCYYKILQSRIIAQLKKVKNVETFKIHELSYSFFNEIDSRIVFDKILSMNHEKKEKNPKENKNNKSEKNNEPIQIILATREIASMLLISLLSNEKPDNRINSLLVELKNNKTIIPLIQLSMNELNILFVGEQEIELHIDEDYSKIKELLTEIEKTHKDASSGLSTSFMQLAEKYPE